MNIWANLKKILSLEVLDAARLLSKQCEASVKLTQHISQNKTPYSSYNDDCGAGQKIC